MKHYTEKNMEEHIEKYLVSENKYEKINKINQTKYYNKKQCIYAKDFINFIKNTQGEKFKVLENHFKSDADKRLLKVVNDQIRIKGIKNVLHNGIDEMGQNFKIVYFSPKSQINKIHVQNYSKNIFSIMRQFKYSSINNNSVDICILINGIPLFTLELKNSLTNQTHLDAIRQYIKDRNPDENIFNFNRCIAHFAIGTEELYFTTKLNGDKTSFLPFNKINNTNYKKVLKLLFLEKNFN